MRQNKFTKIQFDIADDRITNRSTIGGKAWVFEPVSNTCKNRNLIGKLKTLSQKSKQAVSVESLSKNFKNLIQKLRLWELPQQTLDETTDSNRASIQKPKLWELPQQTLDEETDSNRASIQKPKLWELPQQTLDEETDSNRASTRKSQNLWELPQQTLGETTDSNHASTQKRQNLWELPQQTLDETTDSNHTSIQKPKLWELPQQTLGETTGIQIQKTESKGLGMNLNTSKIMNIGFEGGKRISIQNTSPVKNRFSLRTKLVSLVMLLTFAVVFVIPLTIFEELHAQSVPALGST
ncbi:hypothetical protein, partial [Leptospira santarosai]